MIFLHIVDPIERVLFSKTCFYCIQVINNILVKFGENIPTSVFILNFSFLRQNNWLFKVLF